MSDSERPTDPHIELVEREPTLLEIMRELRYLRADVSVVRTHQITLSRRSEERLDGLSERVRDLECPPPNYTNGGHG